MYRKIERSRYVIIHYYNTRQLPALKLFTIGNTKLIDITKDNISDSQRFKSKHLSRSVQYSYTFCSSAFQQSFKSASVFTERHFRVSNYKDILKTIIPKRYVKEMLSILINIKAEFIMWPVIDHVSRPSASS